MVAKPSAEIQRISLWRIREKRRQEAKAKDKADIVWLESRMRQLETEVVQWRSWYWCRRWHSDWVDADELDDERQSCIEHHSSGQQHKCNLKREDQEDEAKEFEVEAATNLRPIDYSKWDHIYCSSDEQSGMSGDEDSEKAEADSFDEGEEEAWLSQFTEAEEENDETWRLEETAEEEKKNLPGSVCEMSQDEGFMSDHANNKRIILGRLGQARHELTGAFANVVQNLTTMAIPKEKVDTLTEHCRLRQKQLDSYISMVKEMDERQFDERGSEAFGKLLEKWRLDVKEQLEGDLRDDHSPNS